jgi:hypothetical protein
MKTRTAALLASVALALTTVTLTSVPSPADAATGAPLAWGVRTHVAGIDGFAAITCPSTTLCVAGGDLYDAPGGYDSFVRFATTTTPAVAGSWRVVDVAVPAGEYNNGINEISCPSVSLCVAVDGYGHIFSSTDPAGPASAWKVFTFNLPGSGAVKRQFSSVSCPSVTRCVALDQRSFLATTTTPTTADWTFTPTEYTWGHVSCTQTFCVANGGDSVYSTTDPAAAASTWTKSTIVPSSGCCPDSHLTNVTCYAPSTCLATDFGGAGVAPRTWSSISPLGGTATWHFTKNAPMDDATCVQGATILCVGWTVYSNWVDATTAPTGQTADWVVSNSVADDTISDQIRDVSCPSPALCVAVTAKGMAIIGTGTGNGTVGGGGAGGTTIPWTGPGLDGGNSYRVGDDAVAFALNSANDVTGSIAAMTAAGYAPGDYSRLLGKAKPKKKHVKVGKATFSLKAGVTQTVRVKLTKAARSLLAVHHSLKIVLTITATTTAGVRTVTTHTVKIKAAKKKKK